jgi:hypothetical protein
MSCQSNNRTKNSTFVWNEQRTCLINTAAITLSYYASLNTSQLTRTELTCDLPNTVGSIESNLGCSTQSSPFPTPKVDDSTVIVGTGDQLELGLATGTNQTHSKVNLGLTTCSSQSASTLHMETCVQPELGLATGTNQTHSKLNLGLTTCSSQPDSFMTHNEHTQSHSLIGPMEVTTSLASRSGPQEVPTSCGPHLTSGQGGSDLLAHTQRGKSPAMESFSQLQRDHRLFLAQRGSDHIVQEQPRL